MAKGGDFGLDPIRHFNGNLFDDAAVVHPTPDEMLRIKEAARLDWGQIDPSIFGTLFERGMDPAKRSQLGAHYTSREDIETLVEPVLMQPLRREWAEVRGQVESPPGRRPSTARHRPPKKQPRPRKAKAGRSPDALIRDFLAAPASVTVLDPACGSGNFLYVALQKLKDLEKEVLVYRQRPRARRASSRWSARGSSTASRSTPTPTSWPRCRSGSATCSGSAANGFRSFPEPILQRLDTIECKDAILDLTDPDNPQGARVARGRVHRREPAVPGRQEAAIGAWR